MSASAHSNPRQPDSARRRRNTWPARPKPQHGPKKANRRSRAALRCPAELPPRHTPPLSPQQLRDAFESEEPDEPAPEYGDFYLEPDAEQDGLWPVF